MVYIEFKATGSNLRRTDLNKVVAYTQNELSARFSLNSDWDDLNPIVAIFSKDNGPAYDMVLDDNRECTVPWEVLLGKGVLTVSLVGGSTLTSTEVEINVLATGQLGGLASQPSNTLYEQLLTKYNKIEADWESCKTLLDTYKSEVSASTSAIDSTRENAVQELTDIKSDVDSLLEGCKQNLSNAKTQYDKMSYMYSEGVGKIDELKSNIKKIKLSQIVKSSTFDTELLDFDENGFLYRCNNLPEEHQNYVWLKTEKENISGFLIKFKIKVLGGALDFCRPAVELSDGSKRFYNFYRTDEENNVTVNIYDENTKNVGSAKKVVAVKMDYGEHTFRLRKVGRYMFFYYDDVYFAYFMDSTSSDIKNVGYNFRGSGNQSRYKDYFIETKKSFAHMSLDDQLGCLKDLTDNKDNYSSLFESPYLAPIKTLHDEYGCKFTLMLFNTDKELNFSLSDVTDKFYNEFEENAHWLKFAYHGPDTTTYPAKTMSVDDFVNSMDGVYKQITRFASQSCIDKVPRISFFNCTKEQVKAAKVNGLIMGLLTADDARTSNVGLNTEELNIMKNFDTYTDYENNISYFRTEERLDGASTEQVLDRLNKKYDNQENSNIFIIFAHSITSEKMQNNFKVVAEWLNKRGIVFDFPCNKLGY